MFKGVDLSLALDLLLPLAQPQPVVATHFIAPLGPILSHCQSTATREKEAFLAWFNGPSGQEAIATYCPLPNSGLLMNPTIVLQAVVATKGSFPSP